MIGMLDKRAAIVAVILLLQIHSPAVLRSAVLQEVLTNAAIVEMVKAGLSNTVVVLKIQAAVGRFDTSTDGIVSLKRQGVPDQIIEAILQKQSNAESPASSTPAPEIVLHGSAPGELPQRLSEAPYTQSLSVGLFSVGFKTVIPGKHSMAETLDQRPAIDIRIVGADPRRFILSRLSESDEGGARQLNLESSEPMDLETLGADRYRLRPRKPLKRGEYCLYQILQPGHGTSEMKARIFDFRVTVAGR